MKKFEFKTDRLGKKIDVNLRGMFKPQDAKDYVNEYQKVIGTINSKEYRLQFDCTEMIITPADAVPMLKGCFEMYKQAGFNKVVAKISKTNGLIMKMQFNRLAKETGLTNFEVTM